ncbi:MAG: AAA family ATPase [Candidatus Eremiobacteraeota bacterium]|nr:AAA family ATPase [Candidatus Eremiobacteraeota bacterium]
MEVITPQEAGASDADPKLELQSDVDRARAEREDLERQIVSDRERLGEIRTVLDTMVNATWRDVFGQVQGMRERENINSALSFAWLPGYQWVLIAAIAIVAAGAVALLQVTGALIAAGIYLVLAVIGYFVARDQCLAHVKKARSSYLGSDGKDVRLVAFTHYEPGLSHPLIGFDGPTNGTISDRAWKIPGVREKDALDETFVEVIDERRSNVLLTRFPDKKPTLVHADLENPFIRAYGVSFQRALERHMPNVVKEAAEFRSVVQHFGQRKTLDERLRKLEAELHEYDGTASIMRSLPVSSAVRNKMIRQVVLFRLGDVAARRGLFLVTGDRADPTDVLQTLARASAASLLHLSFSQIKIGYVGQGASTVSRLFESAKRARSIIFIDEAERFFASGGSAAYESMRREVVQAIAKEWDALAETDDVWIVAAANTRDDLDAAMTARFGTVIDFTPPDAAMEHRTMVIDGAAAAVASLAIDDVVLPELVTERLRLLSAMFAHVETMESQGITVPRAVLVAGPSNAAKQFVIRSLAEQTSLPVIDTLVDDIDSAVLEARDRALLAVEVPEYADPGALAHLAVLIDELNANKAAVFILATVGDAEKVDPELRERFAETIDLHELDGESRRAKLREVLDGKPLEFELDEAIEVLELQTEGMTEQQLRHFTDEALRKAALRAIDSGSPDHISIALADFEPRSAAVPVATKGDEAGL